MILRNRDFLSGGAPPEEMLRSALKEHAQHLPRLKRLMGYYRMEDSPILKRERAVGLPNNRVAHAFARYIVTVTTGYLIGEPVSYRTATDSPTLTAITDAFRRSSVASADVENARNAAIYGRGVEYISSDAQAIPRAFALSPENAFVVYDDTHEMLPMFGVYFSKRTRADGSQDGYRVWVMTDNEVIEYNMASEIGSALTMRSATQHHFGSVPLVEYWNDDQERGDFEWVLSLIDAYDKLQSDRVNDKEQFVDRMLLLTGCTLETDAQGRPPWRQLREDKALCLPDTDARADYLSVEMNENGTEILRSALERDIHKLSMVPDLSDEHFASNASGVAMRYKLLGLDQLTRIKQQWFTEGLRQRLRLFAHFMEIRGNPALDVADIEIEFSRAMPINELELAETVRAAEDAGAVSTETKVRMLHRSDKWDDDAVQAETQRIRTEQQSNSPVSLFESLNRADTLDEE